jgi:4-hydroxy 2-oxovalerate aldolase
MNFEVMDVTLRESNYVKGNCLSSDMQRKIVQKLYKANIDLIEIGYLGTDSEYGPANVNSNYIDFLTEGGSGNWDNKFVVMINPENFKTEYIDTLKDSRVRMIRFTIAPEKISIAKKIFTFLKDTNIEISANITRVSNLSIDRIQSMSNELVADGADYIYLADSNGALMPEKVGELISSLGASLPLDTNIGFHAHNHLDMAMMNTISSIKNGCRIVDASIQGYGKSTGNLSLESFIASEHNMHLGDDKFDLKLLVQLSADCVSSFLNSDFYSKKAEGVLIGSENINLDELKTLEKDADSAKRDFVNYYYDRSDYD